MANSGSRANGCNESSWTSKREREARGVRKGEKVTKREKEET